MGGIRSKVVVTLLGVSLILFISGWGALLEVRSVDQQSNEILIRQAAFSNCAHKALSYAHQGIITIQKASLISDPSQIKVLEGYMASIQKTDLSYDVFIKGLTWEQKALSLRT